MIKILVDKEESEQSKDIVNFLKTLTPDIQEKLKVIIWWESLKSKKVKKPEVV